MGPRSPLRCENSRPNRKTIASAAPLDVTSCPGSGRRHGRSSEVHPQPTITRPKSSKTVWRSTWHYVAIWDNLRPAGCGEVKRRELPRMTTVDQHGLIRFVRLGLGCTEVKLLTGSQNLNIPQIMKCRPQVSLLSSKGGNTGGVRICTREQHETATVFTCFHSLSRTGREREREKERLTRTPHTQDMLGYCSDQWYLLCYEDWFSLWWLGGYQQEVTDVAEADERNAWVPKVGIKRIGLAQVLHVLHWDPECFF